MKKEIILSIFAICFSGLNFVSAQGFKTPTDGKAAIYFTRTVSFGSSALIDIFDGKEYVTSSATKGYSVYECEPGEHVFWISAENTNFITATVEAGKVYIAQVYIYPSAIKSKCKIVPQNKNDKILDGYNASLKIIKTMPPKVINEKTYSKRRAMFEKNKFMERNMNDYDINIKGNDDVIHISSDMNVPKTEF